MLSTLSQHTSSFIRKGFVRAIVASSSSPIPCNIYGRKSAACILMISRGVSSSQQELLNENQPKLKTKQTANKSRSSKQDESVYELVKKYTKDSKNTSEAANLRARLNAFKVFELNTVREVEEKCSYLENTLALPDEQIRHLLFYLPMLMNESKEDLENRVKHFREKWHCSDEDMRRLFATEEAKKIQEQSLEDLERMHRVYIEEWRISDDKLSSTLLNWHYWYKYQRHLKDKGIKMQQSKTVEYREKIEKIRSFFSREFGITFIKLVEIDRIMSSKIFDENSEEELKQKIHYLSSKSSVDLSAEEIKRLVLFVPVILNESMEEMEKKVEYFKVKLGCSKEELKKIYLIRGVVVSQAMWRLELLDRILGEEYGLEVEDINRLMLDDHFIPDRLSDMMKELIERKHLFRLMFNKHSQFITALRNAPTLLWMPVEDLKRKIRLFAQGLGATSLDEMGRIFVRGASNVEEQHIVTNCKHILSLLMNPSSLDWDDIKMLHVKELESEEKRRLEEAFRRKYQSELKKMESEASYGEKAERGRRTDKDQARETQAALHAAFFEEKAATLSAQTSRNDVSTDSPSLYVTRRWSLEAWSLAYAPSSASIANPYHRLLRECLEEEKRGDLLKELGGYEEERERIEKALRRGEGREKEGAIGEEEEGKEVGWMAMGLIGGKEVEKMALSHEEAKKICITSGCIGHNFISVLPKVISMASRLQLTGEELMSIYSRYPHLTYLDPDENILPKLLEVGRAAERFVRDGGGGGSEGMEAWKNGIGEVMSVEEGREYYRKHPVVRLMREFVSKQSPKILSYSMNRFKGGIKQWEEEGKEEREWKRLYGFVMKYRSVDINQVDKELVKTAQKDLVRLEKTLARSKKKKEVEKKKNQTKSKKIKNCLK